MNSKQFTLLLVVTFMAGMVWLISDIIFNTKPSIEISDKLQATLEPINPTFNTRVMDIIQNQTMDRSQIKVTRPIAPEREVSEIPLPSPQASPSAAAQANTENIEIITPVASSSSSISPEEGGITP